MRMHGGAGAEGEAWARLRRRLVKGRTGGRGRSISNPARKTTDTEPK